MKRMPIGLLVILFSLFLLPCMPLCAQGAALEMNIDVAVTGTVSATSFSGSGAGITNIPGSAIAGTSITVNQLADGAVTPVKIGFLGKVAIVATSGWDYTNPATAMADYVSWCGTLSAINPCQLKIIPGVYDVGTSPVVMQPYIDIEGSGENTTVITGAVSNASHPPSKGVVNGASNAEIRVLTARNTGTGTYVAALLNDGASPRMTHITATGTGGTYNYGLYNYATCAYTTKIDRSTFSGSTNSIYNDSEITLRIGASNLSGGTVNATATYNCVGVYEGDTYIALNAT